MIECIWKNAISNVDSGYNRLAIKKLIQCRKRLFAKFGFVASSVQSIMHRFTRQAY